MVVLACAANADQLAAISDTVHDWWFDLDTVRFDESSGCVTIELMAEEDYRRAVKGEAVPSRSKIKLVVENAIALDIEDSERVGYYDLNRLEFDEHAGIVRLLTGIPLVVEIRVSAVSALVERLDER